MWTSEEKSRDQVTILAGVKYLAGFTKLSLTRLAIRSSVRAIPTG